MSEASSTLRQQFMTETDDGIAKCETIIQNAGGTVNKGMIQYVGNDHKVLDAIAFLIQEWDYAWSES